MSRSLKKAPYVEEKLFNRVEAMNAKNVEYKKWYFGSMHTDKYISGNQVAVFRNILNAKTGLKI